MTPNAMVNMNESRKDKKDTIEFLLGTIPRIFRRLIGCPKLDEEDFKRARERAKRL
jgi:hypothetical protein